MRKHSIVMLAALSLALSLSSVYAADAAGRQAVTSWAHWRGPAYNGTSEAIRLPEKIAPETNLLWSTPVPGVGSSSPIVANGHVYLSLSDASTKKLRALSLEVATGKMEWIRDVTDVPNNNARNTFASPSATADAQGAVFLFGNGDIASFDSQGSVRWARKLSADYGRIANDWVYSSSTLLLNDTLYMQVLQRTESYVLGLNPADGKTKWKVNRPTTAVGESHDSYATPIPMVTKEGVQILIFGGDFLTAHDPATGKELWRFGGYNTQQKQDWRVIPSPVADGERAYVSVARGSVTLAIKSGGSGDVTQTHRSWGAPDSIGTDSPTPALHDGTLYILDSTRKKLHALDAASGKLKTTTLLGGEAVFSGSPTVADGKIYCLSEAGEVVILSIDGPKILSRLTLEDKGVTRATITAIDDKIFVRTATKLWCFGNK